MNTEWEKSDWIIKFLKDKYKFIMTNLMELEDYITNMICMKGIILIMKNSIMED